MPRDPYRRGKPTPPLRRAADGSSRLRDDEATMVRCELCVGCGMVPPEVAALFSEMLGKIKEQA